MVGISKLIMAPGMRKKKKKVIFNCHHSEQRREIVRCLCILDSSGSGGTEQELESDLLEPFVKSTGPEKGKQTAKYFPHIISLSQHRQEILSAYFLTCICFFFTTSQFKPRR